MARVQDLDVYGVGNALVDLQIQIEDSFLDLLEVPKGQMMLADADRQSSILQALSNLKVNKCSGGSVANTIVGVADFGGKGAYCGRVADDAMGDFFVEDMESMGIVVDRGRAEQGVTGTSLVAITPDAQRTMLTHLGVAAKLDPDDIAPETIGRCKYAYIEGYLFAGDPTKEAALHAIEIAQELGVKIALTVSDPFVINIARDLFWELIEGPVDLLFCNEQEARALTEKDDPIECAREIHRHAENVALTLGANGSLIMHENEAYPIEGVPVDQVDTTGAGDMYAAGVLYGVTQGMSWPAAGHLASHAAARIVSQLGARLEGKLSALEIARLMRRD